MDAPSGDQSALPCSAKALCRQLQDVDWPEGGWRQPEGAKVCAAVLVALIADGEGDSVLLTRRSGHLRDHPGQVCFPGGCVDPADRSCEETALREAYEEVGLSPEQVQILGRLGRYHTGTGYLIDPVVALVHHVQTVWRPAPDEVDEVFFLPLPLLLDGGGREEVIKEFHGRRMRFPALNYRGRVIWGATAGILDQLAELFRKAGVSRLR